MPLNKGKHTNLSKLKICTIYFDKQKQACSLVSEPNKFVQKNLPVHIIYLVLKKITHVLNKKAHLAATKTGMHLAQDFPPLSFNLSVTWCMTSCLFVTESNATLFFVHLILQQLAT